MLFDDLDREFSGPPIAGEPHFAYLNRSGRAEMAKVRNLIEEWLSRYPEGKRRALISRLRSPIDDEHLSACFELVLHELLLRNGCTVEEVEPALPNSTRTPDFLVRSPRGEQFYLEAALVTGRTREQAAAQRRFEAVLAAVESVDSAWHFLDVQPHGIPSQPPRLRALRTILQKWVDALPKGQDAKSVAPFQWEEHGLRLTIKPIPRKRKRGADETRAVGMLWGTPTVSTPGDGIRETLLKKATRYGELDAPLIIAVNSLKLLDDDQDTIAALFGSPSVIVRSYENGEVEYIDSRNPDGVWHDNQRPRRTGVSGVISAHRLTPASVARRRASLIINPWAERQFDESMLRLDKYIPNGDALIFSEGDSLGVMFDLPEQWPEDD
jgi:hypothetical protein